MTGYACYERRNNAFDWLEWLQTDFPSVTSGWLGASKQAFWVSHLTGKRDLNRLLGFHIWLVRMIRTDFLGVTSGWLGDPNRLFGCNIWLVIGI